MEEVYSVWAGRVASKKIFQGEFMYVYEKKNDGGGVGGRNPQDSNKKKNRMKPSLLQLNLSLFLA